MMLPELYIDANATLAEGPAWDAKTQTLYWIDILERRVYAGSKPILQLDQYVGSVAPRRNGGLVIAQRGGIWTLEANMKKRKKIAALEGEPACNRFNDGKCDPRGRFIVGTMDHREQETSGALYSLSPAGKFKRLLKMVRISNGLAWSPDGGTLYFADTPTRQILAFDYHLETGRIGNTRVRTEKLLHQGGADVFTSSNNNILRPSRDLQVP